MQYRKDKYNNDISLLGFGCMRFPLSSSELDKIILEAYNQGVNYFDTAYVYPNSEIRLGEILNKHNIRDKVYIATKLPHYMIKNIDNLEKMFNEQLKRLKTDYIDYYLMHMLSDVETWERLCNIGIIEWIEKKKEEGKIKQIGFSYHGNTDMFCKLINSYDWDITLVQYNYIDENSQAGRKGIEYATKKGIPVFIMEPLRGGRLVNNLSKETLKTIKDYKEDFTPAEIAFKWLYNQPEITCVLSGMNSMEMLKENCIIVNNTAVGEMNKHKTFYKKIKASILAKMKVNCTGCGYCMPCPQKVDIPGIFSAYNRKYTDSSFWGFIDYIVCTSIRKNNTAASNCISCEKCEKSCPQNIKISKELKTVKNVYEGQTYKIIKKIISLFEF